MVAPLRISIAQAAGPKFLCFGKEGRAEMSPARAHAKVPPCDMTVTVVRRPRLPQRIVLGTNGTPEGELVPPSEQGLAQSSRSGNVPSPGVEELLPNLEAWAPRALLCMDLPSGLWIVNPRLNGYAFTRT